MVVTVYSNDKSIDWDATGTERIVQNVRNILRTRQFEVPFMRGLGIDSDFIDSDNNKMKHDFIPHIINVINANEDRATVLDVRIESFDASGEYIIAVDLEV